MFSNIRRSLKRLHQDTSGAMSVEKILILALIALPIAIALMLFRNTLIGWFRDQTNQLNIKP